MIAKLCLLAMLVALLWYLTGCAAVIPIGRDGQHGFLHVECRYMAPLPNILREKPDLGGLSK